MEGRKFWEQSLAYIFDEYALALEEIAKQYETARDHPPIERNQTAVSGSIRWARQLYRAASEPMEVFIMSGKTVLSSKRAKRTVKLYNRLSQALLLFEDKYFEAWSKQIKDIKLALQVIVFNMNSQARGHKNYRD